MKRITALVVAVCSLLLAANAQTDNEHGKFWLGGSVGFNVTKESSNYSSDEKTTAATYKLLPEFGYNFSKYWALGVSVGYSHEEECTYMSMVSISSAPSSGFNTPNVLSKTPWYKETITGINVDIFTRFSFLQGSLGKLFLDGGIRYMWGKSKVESLLGGYFSYLLGDGYSHDDSVTIQSYAIGIRPGVWVNVTRHIALTGKFGFLGYQYRSEPEGEGSTYGLDLDMSQFQIGVNIVL